MNEHRIVSESVWYDTVLPSGNLYTKRLLERIVKQFHEDENFREKGTLMRPSNVPMENTSFARMEKSRLNDRARNGFLKSGLIHSPVLDLFDLNLAMTVRGTLQAI